jgi:hypothetical protein
MTINYVAEEPVDDLVQALGQFRSRERSDGMVNFDIKLDFEEAAPLRRALMRIEADLLLEDADLIGEQHPTEERTDEQRRADALMELVLRVGDAFSA